MTTFQQKIEETIDKLEISTHAELLYQKRQAVSHKLRALGTSEFEIDCYLEAFAIYDRNSDGLITEKEIVKIFSCLNRNVPVAQIQNIILKKNKSGNGAIEYVEFVDMLHTRRMQMQQDPNIDEFKIAFQYLDIDNSGTVSWKKMKETLIRLGQVVSDDDAKDMLRIVQSDVEKGINFDDFVKICKCRV